MDYSNILIPALSIGGIGITLGLILGVAAKIFAVSIDPKIAEVREALPGNNCGGCGYAGCDSLAKAIVSLEAPLHACPVGGAKLVTVLADIMGMEATTAVKKTAYVKCKGSKEFAKERYQYHGIEDCRKLALVPGKGPKSCEFGCLGMGSCVRACQFDAIDIIDGIAIINEAKCTSCGQCVSTCPKNLIEIVPQASRVRVQCHSEDKGKDTKTNCQVGCIGCKMCERACEFDAVKVINNIAHIDYSKCTQCNKCAEKCPVKVIQPGKQIEVNAS